MLARSKQGTKKQSIGFRLRVLRKDCGKKLRQVSEVSGISISFLSEIERGARKPSLDALSRLADTYGYTLSEILHGVVVSYPGQEIVKGMSFMVEVQ